MRFVAREDKNKTWRLGRYRKDTYYGTNYNGGWEPFIFWNEYDARECADRLNKEFPDFFTKLDNNEITPDYVESVLKIINQFIQSKGAIIDFLRHKKLIKT